MMYLFLYLIFNLLVISFFDLFDALTKRVQDNLLFNIVIFFLCFPLFIFGVISIYLKSKYYDK